MLVEDVLTTASQAISAAHRLTAQGLQVTAILYVIDREEGADANIKAAGFDPRPLFRKGELGI